MAEKTTNGAINTVLNSSDLFEIRKVLAITPKDDEWPIPEANFLKATQTPYLQTILEEAKAMGLSRDQMMEAWNDMLYMKSNDVFAPEFEHVPLGEALHQLFFGLDYHRTKQHYVAYLSIVNN